MGLRGPLPKNKDQRARRGMAVADIPNIELVFEASEAPELPTKMIDDEGNLIEIPWSPLTLDWWNDWLESPQAKIFSRSDWRSLLTTAFVANAFFTTGKSTYAAELRQREAQFGATPLDRLRLRMAWMDDKEKSAQYAAPVDPAKTPAARYAGLKAVSE